jgi:hypothetical protein
MNRGEDDGIEYYPDEWYAENAAAVRLVPWTGWRTPLPQQQPRSEYEDRNPSQGLSAFANGGTIIDYDPRVTVPYGSSE